MKLLQLVHSVPAKAAPFSIAAAVSDAPTVAAASADDQIPVLPAVFIPGALRGLIYVVDAACQLIFAEVVDQPGVFLLGKPHPAVRAVLVAHSRPCGSGRGSAVPPTLSILYLTIYL